MRPERDHDYERLEQEVGGEPYASLLQRLQQTNEFLRPFASWNEVAAFMRGGAADDPRKDEVLRPILAAHAEDRATHWRTVIIVLFWPRLRAVCHKREHWDRDVDALWANTLWAFLQSVCHHDLTRRSHLLFRQLTNSATRRLGDEYRKARRRTAFEVPTDPEIVERLAGGTKDCGPSGLELQEEQDLRIERLREHLAAGRISETGFHILVGTSVYGKGLHEYAKEEGLSYQAAKKRRQRAEAAIRRYEKSDGRTDGPCPHPRRCPRSVLPEENRDVEDGGPGR